VADGEARRDVSTPELFDVVERYRATARRETEPHHHRGRRRATARDERDKKACRREQRLSL
jgi:hypothetical protein